MTRPALFPLADLHRARDAVDLGSRFARAWDAPLLLLHTVVVPPTEPLSQGASEAQRVREHLEAVAGSAADVRVRPVVRVGHEPWEEIVAACLEHDAALLVLVWDDAGQTHLFERSVDFILHHPPCDLVLMPQLHHRAFSKILVGVRGGPNAELALRIATALAESESGEVTGLHVFRDDIPERERWREERPYVVVMEHAEATVRKRIAAGSAADIIARESADYTAVIVGATADPKQPAIQPAFRQIRPLIVVSSAQPVDTWMARHAGTSSRWSVPEVEKWFAENTFHAREFADLERLVALKEQRGVTVSLGLPALNEEETVGHVIRVLRDALVRDVPLLDEIVLIDSDSTDRTREIAQQEGISVHCHPGILPEHGSHSGKGEALWKSLHVLRGDIVAWVDTDIRNMHPKFVYGLIGPLLREDHIQFVKGYYRRPVQVGGRIYETGGGRVTELTARPLFNLFFPELSGLIQPLAGEYAGRREVLEQIPFFTGYGVETGMLIDILNRFGLGAIGQVDLEQRIHRNQSLQMLSMMSFQIIQVVMQRLGDRLTVPLLRGTTPTMKLIRSAEGQLALEEREVIELERPPIATLKEYRARRTELAQERAPSRYDRSGTPRA